MCGWHWWRSCSASHEACSMERYRGFQLRQTGVRYLSFTNFPPSWAFAFLLRKTIILTSQGCPGNSFRERMDERPHSCIFKSSPCPTYLPSQDLLNLVTFSSSLTFSPIVQDTEYQALLLNCSRAFETFCTYTWSFPGCSRCSRHPGRDIFKMHAWSCYT